MSQRKGLVDSSRVEAKNTYNTSNKREWRIYKLASLNIKTSRRPSKKPTNDNLKKHTKS